MIRKQVRCIQKMRVLALIFLYPPIGYRSLLIFPYWWIFACIGCPWQIIGFSRWAAQPLGALESLFIYFLPEFDLVSVRLEAITVSATYLLFLNGIHYATNLQRVLSASL